MIDIDNDAEMTALYAETPSVKSRLGRLDKILAEEGVPARKRETLSRRLLCMLVPAGTKGAVRGRIFNKMVEREISKALGRRRGVGFSVEEAHPLFQEIPDWVLRKGKSTLVGFNQVSLFGGGHQLNRGGKYVTDETLHRRLARRGVRMVCIVKDVPGRGRGKAWEITRRGVAKRRLYTLGGIKKLVEEFLK